MKCALFLGGSVLVRFVPKGQHITLCARTHGSPAPHLYTCCHSCFQCSPSLSVTWVQWDKVIFRCWGELEKKFLIRLMPGTETYIFILYNCFMIYVIFHQISYAIYCKTLFYIYLWESKKYWQRMTCHLIPVDSKCFFKRVLEVIQYSIFPFSKWSNYGKENEIS